MPEEARIYFQRNDTLLNISNNQYQLRPETAESICFMHKFTGLPKYREMAWNLFLGINSSTRAKFGISWVRNLNGTQPHPPQRRRKLFFAETLKYLYLTFSVSDLLHPTESVFNTEAHPLKIISESEAKKWVEYFLKSTSG
jgi:mannosyl-oligosaccharide alpha-1,2-mannosidase